jgi:structural maintenance of chromosome 1
MRIRSLVIIDFKSYRGRHELGPFHDFTAVIGENGTGKSNCFDAICFVLGASAKSMRCQRLSDLISTSTPRPKSATVELFFDGSRTIQMIRRTMAGDRSVHHIDGAEVSSADYLQALAQVGFDPAQQSFIVFQGDIQNIATMKPKMLTQLFEELSGSSTNARPPRPDFRTWKISGTASRAAGNR